MRNKEMDFCAFTPQDDSQLDSRYTKILSIFSTRQPKKILDIGCGDGNFSRMISNAAKASELYGVEISEEGKKRAIEAGVKFVTLNVGKETFPFESDYFDAVFAGEVIEHLIDPDHMLDEIYRVLKPEGFFLLTTPNLAWWMNRVSGLLGFYPIGLNPGLRYPIGHIKELPLNSWGTPAFVDHIRLFTFSSLTKLLELHGLKIVESKGIGGLIPKEGLFLKIVNWIDALIARVFISCSFRVVIECKKVCK